MQYFKFQSYVDFFEYLPPEQQQITEVLKELIVDVIPDVKIKLSWNVPYFYKNKNICFIWPGAVPWGKKTYDHVTLGFAKAHLIPEKGFLEMSERKKVGSRIYTDLNEIEAELEDLERHLILAENVDQKL